VGEKGQLPLIREILGEGGEQEGEGRTGRGLEGSRWEERFLSHG